ncbi:effector-associated domain 2-containing protein [Streptomyces sp. DHE17-7]|uniref:effector-associated domain 2-containing protein n=1 Tax=Streptomyces sp. DHE17-7 TaxID=2759949 RepID=UPI0022EA8C87|nr:hypothetical protein [Streptomyces sp. DHE17-7]MBJ6621861.1 hypothetical protein [Streptomyces sp. DHE17-7]
MSPLLFAGLLGDLLGGRTVDLRGIRQREDVVALIRAALNTAGGEHQLVEAVRIFEGELARGDSCPVLIGGPRPGARPAAASPGPSKPTERTGRRGRISCRSVPLPRAALAGAKSTLPGSRSVKSAW